ncbi:hypothetical protein ACGC1H_005446 [Rhizoctonia solani]|uniref:AN1-type domain-containing protein n=1 Tax=Rhizoctonia solani TaxID=456999 RepID=A0A8H3GUH2_9AGAM|nr:unnamed protein product [Rhizoctonia solani]
MATRKGSTDAQMMFVGSACSLPSCSLHDFLPIRCNLCSETFCSDHFKPGEHTCPKFDPSTADRIAPSCPLCDTPVSVPLGRDVNDVMDNHIMKECTAAGNRKSASPTNRCPAPRCNKVMYAPIRCDNCRKEFCPSHRFPKQHVCTASARPSPSPSPAPTSTQPTMSKLAEKFSSVGMRPGPSGPSTSAAMAAISRAAASAKPAPKPNVASSSQGAGPSKPAVPNPFNKTDRRAKAERLSQLKALQERNRKGLLSEAEKSRLAQLQNQAKQDGDCVLM